MSKIVVSASPLSGDRVTEGEAQRGITMDERTMFELLEIYDAKSELQEDQEMLSEIKSVDEQGDRILRGLSYVISIIARYSPVYHPAKDRRISAFWKILDDKTNDNHEKARLLLGRAA